MSSQWDTDVNYERGVRDAIRAIEEEADFLYGSEAESFALAVIERLNDLIEEERDGCEEDTDNEQED